MPLEPTWPDIIFRLAAAALASTILGFDRGIHGHAAGLRTTTLVGVAAAIAMVQANILLPVEGKTIGSFATLDLMRMPLGILTGVGFIGGGVIIKKGASIRGVTTAATLWITTTIGLAFGGGQMLLGLIGTFMGIATLVCFRWVDSHIHRRREGILVLAGQTGLPSPDLNSRLRPLGCTASRVSQELIPNAPGLTYFRYKLRWSQTENENRFDCILQALEVLDVRSFEMELEDL